MHSIILHYIIKLFSSMTVLRGVHNDLAFRGWSGRTCVLQHSTEYFWDEQQLHPGVYIIRNMIQTTQRI